MHKVLKNFALWGVEMELCGAVFMTDREQTIEEVLWGSQMLKNKYGSIWNGFRGRRLDEVFPLHGQHSGQFMFQMEAFSFQRLAVEQTFLCLVCVGRNVQDLYEQAFENFPQGVQIYDQDGHILYINENSRRISALPPLSELRGRHLLDVWDLKTDVSTTLSCLREQAPIRDRIDTFLDANKGNITTINTAYPVMKDNELLGAALFEMDMGIAQQQQEYFKSVERNLKSYAEQVPEEQLSGYNFDCIVGDSERMRNAKELAKRFAQQDCNVLLVGETGTGKEMFAQSIHRASPRRDKPFVAINCAAVPEPLIESMLFGTKKGAFTGSEDKEGLFEEANGGTLFLDEVNSMSLAMQSKLLRVVQEGIFRRIGSNKDFHTDVRILSSCNEDPFKMLENYTMRRDFFYRLSTVQVQIPPLRERPEDIQELVDFYLERKRAKYAKRIDYIAPGVMDIFRAYHWPGNVRELFHVLEYILNVTDGGVITERALPAYLLSSAPAEATKRESTVRGLPSEQELSSATLEELMGEYESQILERVLEHYGGNISRAARSLGISRQSLGYRIKKYGIIV